MKRAMKTCISILLSFCLLLTLLPAAFAEEAIPLEPAVNEVALSLGDDAPEDPPQLIDEDAPEEPPQPIDDELEDMPQPIDGGELDEEPQSTDDSPSNESDSALEIVYEDIPGEYTDPENPESVQSDPIDTANAVSDENRIDISGWTIADIDPLEYTGEARVLTEFSLSDGSGKALVEGTDYTLSYENNINAGDATLIVTGIGNYKGEIRKTFQITPCSFDTFADVDPIPDQTYDGTAKEPELTVKDSESQKALVKGTDYTVAYANNTEVGKATATLTGIGNYKDTKEVKFNIVEARNTLTITLKDGKTFNRVYDGTANFGQYVDHVYHPFLTPDDFNIAGVAEGDTVTLDADYLMVRKFGSKNAGSYTVALTFEGHLTSSAGNTYAISADSVKSVTGTITPKTITIKPTAGQSKNVGEADPSLFRGTFSGILQGDIITGKLGRVSGEAVGAYRYTKGTLNTGNNYTIVVEADQTFTIKDPADTQVLVFTQKQRDSLDKAYKAGETSVNLSAARVAELFNVTDASGAAVSNVTATAVATYSSAGPGTDIPVKVVFTVTSGPSGARACDLNTTADIHRPIERRLTIRYKGSEPITKGYDGTTDCTISRSDFEITDGVVSGDTVSISSVEAYYDSASVGTNKTVTVEFTLGQSNARNTYTVRDMKLTGEITAKNIRDNDVTVDTIPNQSYTGSAIEPTVTVRQNNRTLTLNTDYTVSYSNNTKAGTATVTIKGTGNYTGSRTVNFTITDGTTARTVRITLISGHEPKKTYDGTANCGYYTGTAAAGDQAYHPLLSHSDFNVEGVAYGDTVIVDDNYLRTLKFDGKDAGNRTVSVNLANHIQVTSSQYTYVVSSDSVTTIRGTINKKALNITPNPAEQTAVYGSTYTIRATVMGLLTGDSVSGKLGPETTVGAGRYRVTAGTLTVKPDNYAINMVEGYLTIVPKPINATDVTVSSISTQNYTGSAITPSVTIRYGAVTLTKDKDYTLTYANNTNAGTATVTITGKGNYNGSRTVSFRIIRTSSGSSSSSTRTDPIWIVAPHGGSIEVNETISLQGFINDTYPKISRKNWTWASSNAEVATVTGTDMAALVTGRKAGTTTITASTPDRSYIATYVVEVVKPQAAASVRINSGGVSAIGVKAKLQLTAEISPSGTNMPKLKWQTSNSSIATVSSKGLVTGKKAGRVKIRVKTSTGLSDIIQLEVREDTTLRKVTISAPGTTTIGINGTLQLTAIPEPASAVYRMKWQTSNKSIATVSSKGLVTGKKAGRVKIRVITDNGLSDIITLQVADAKLPSKVGIKPSAPQLLGIGKTLRLTARFKPSDAVSMLKWTSSNEKVASVDAKGVVTGISAGSATISVRTENKLTASVKIQVRDPYEPLSIAIKPSQLTALSVNDKLQIKTKMTAIDKAKTRLTWKSSNTKVATVNSEGLVTAKKAGKVTITVTTHNNLSASVKIIVK